jgi:hypothetical protein
MRPNKRFFAPRFLERFDQWLLLNKPETWSTRAHLVAYYGIAFILALAFIAYIFPDDPKSYSGWGNWTLFTSIITLIALVVWLIYLLRFNVFKRYGITSAFARLKVFLLYSFCTVVIMFIPFVQMAVESVKANAAYGDEEIVRDLNTFNTRIVQLEYSNLDHVWSRDTVVVVDTLPGDIHEADEVYIEDSRIAPPHHDQPGDYIIELTPPRYGVIDTATLRNRLRTVDSVERMNDSMYIFLACPQYTFIHASNADKYTSTKLLESTDMYYQVVKDHKPVDRSAAWKEVQGLAKKYDYPHDYYSYESGDLLRTIQSRYSLGISSRSIDNILDRKQRWRGYSLEVILRVLFYLCYITTLLVFVFRHSTVRTFFLSLLTAAVISLLSALILAWIADVVMNFFIVVTVWFCVFFASTVLLWTAKTRNVVLGIGINLFVWMVGFMPLVLVSLYYEILRQRREERGSDETYPEMGYWMDVAEFVGPLLLLVLVGTYIHKVYRRWYGLPGE